MCGAKLGQGNNTWIQREVYWMKEWPGGRYQERGREE